ncbi:MAG: hypothetical protein WC911_01930 [Thermoleophilia bacterium]
MTLERTLGLTCPIPEAIDAQLWLDRFAWPLLESVGASRSKSVFENTDPVVRAKLLDAVRWQLRAVLSEAEIKLGVPMGIRVVKSDPVDSGLRQGIDYDERIGRTPFYPEQCRDEYYPLELPSGTISIERVRLYYLRNLVYEFSPAMGNEDAIRLANMRTGAANLIPQGAPYLLTSTAWLPMMLPSFSLGRTTPDAWAIDYTLGPVTVTGEIGRIELVVVNWCYAAAAKMIFAQAGLARSQGLTNASLSFDGFSKSIGLSSGANTGLYSAIEKSCQDLMDRIDWRALRSMKRGGPRILPYGS